MIKLIDEQFKKTKELMEAEKCFTCHNRVCKCEPMEIKFKDKSPVAHTQDPDQLNDKVKAYWRKQGQW